MGVGNSLPELIEDSAKGGVSIGVELNEDIRVCRWSKSGKTTKLQATQIASNLETQN